MHLSSNHQKTSKHQGLLLTSPEGCTTRLGPHSEVTGGEEEGERRGVRNIEQNRGSAFIGVQGRVPRVFLFFPCYLF